MGNWARFIISFFLCLATATIAPNVFAQSLRAVHDNTIVSSELPKADLTFGSAFRYMGGQQVNLYGVADAEQHLFVKPRKESVVIDAFYWVQFEHRLPSDTNTYNYSSDHTTDIGGLNFVYDVKSWPDYATMQLDDPKSDSAAITRLLEESKLKFPSRTARIRMFHLPTPDRRTELMIIYGEALPEDSSVPVRKEGVDLMKEDPAFAKKLLDDLKTQLTIQTK
jgi:hypothetical protein